jgi:hypothetical protein
LMIARGEFTQLNRLRLPFALTQVNRLNVHVKEKMLKKLVEIEMISGTVLREFVTSVQSMHSLVA